MSHFLKKLVEKASSKKPAGHSDSLKPDDVNPRLIFHYGVPSGSTMLAFGSIQQILAISTKEGQVKLFGNDGSQVLLESPLAAPSKFLLFIENQDILVNVNANNHIEAWDIDKKCLSASHHFDKEITAVCAMHNGVYLYVGDSDGGVSVLRLHPEKCHIEQMKYQIPLLASHGEIGSDIAVKYMSPLPMAETKRVVIIFLDGIIAVWSVQESKLLSSNRGITTLQSTYQEPKQVTAACLVCSFGTKAAVGYSSGDIIVWSIPCPSPSNLMTEHQSYITPIFKLNLGYKADKVPIAKLKWADTDGKSSRLYALGCSDLNSTSLLQVVLLNEHTESRTVKLAIHPPESSVEMEITTSSISQSKPRRDLLLLLGKSSHVYTYDDALIGSYLLHCQTKMSQSLPEESIIKLPYGDSRITTTKFITSLPCLADEDFNTIAKGSSPLFPFEKSPRERSNSNSASFSLSKARNLLITGHASGEINFWDASCPLFLRLASIPQQSDGNLSLSAIPLTALHFIYDSLILISGNQNGMVHIYALKFELFVPQSSFISFQGSSKKGNNQIIHRTKSMKINGAVLSLNTTENMKQLAVGTDQGYVFLFDLEGPTVLYERQIVSEFSAGITSIHCKTCNFHGFEKNVMILATKDSSLLTLDMDTGSTLSSGIVRPNKPSRSLFTQIFGTSSVSSDDSAVKQSFLLLCSEKAIYAYSLLPLIQGVKKVLYKKKFNSSCYWASTFGNPVAGLILLFTSGKIEIRSLLDLSLVKESSIRALTFSNFRSFSISDTIVSSSCDGDIVIVNGDQELLFISTLQHKETYRFLDFASKVVKKDSVNAQGVIGLAAAKDKKKGIFGLIMKENKASRPLLEEAPEDSELSIEELSVIFSAANFPTDTKAEEKIVTQDEDHDLDIDDIDIEDPGEKPKQYPAPAGVYKQNLTNTFQAIKGKLKHVKVKTDKVPVDDETQDERTGAVDQIKRKYGYASTSGESNLNAANLAKTKLGENLKKLQGISLKTSDMQETARSFSTMAKEVLKFAENEKKWSV